MDNIKTLFVISKLKGGGAEHVMMQLANYISMQGNDVQMLITNQKSSDADLNGLMKSIPVNFLEDTLSDSKCHIVRKKIIGVSCRVLEKLKCGIPDWLARISFMEVYGKHVKAAKNILKQYSEWTVVVFLQPANQIMMAACETLPNRIVVSERADPNRYFRTRYAPFFLRHYYPKVSGAVFQTPDAMAAYPEEVRDKGTIILNPISDKLPAAYSGVRKKKIVNFCRLAKQKNLPLLIDAFGMFIVDHPDYVLEIIGDGELKTEIMAYVSSKEYSHAIYIYPHCQNVHELIRDYAMFVSSSDYEGMSNSMLEAMAIGLPVICTDCPIGGARFIIRDHQNGLLVPMNDVRMLADAMSEIADNEKLSRQLSENAAQIRQGQDIKMIGEQWIKLLQNVSISEDESCWGDI